MKRLHYIQHVPYESPGSILDWAHQKKIGVSSTRMYDNENFPDIESVDCLVVMGGPMSTNDDKIYPWLRNEKGFIEKAIRSDKIVLGICLGSQIVANVLGSKINKNKEKEIGWFPVRLAAERGELGPLSFLPDSFTPFHWHSEIFDIPKEAKKIASSDGCDNQAFLYGNKVIGLQFHLEATDDSLAEMVKNGGKELVPGRFVQDKDTIVRTAQYIATNNAYLSKLMDRLAEF